MVGKSGVGKSTLINSIFRGNLVETGIGRPVTKSIRKIEKEGFPLAIYDTPGFELSGQQQSSVKDQIMDLINEGLRSKDINNTIHCIWYCVNVFGNRTFDDTELQWLRNLTESNKVTRVPIIVVLTQAIDRDRAAEMKQMIEKENLDIKKVVPVLAQDLSINREYVAKAYGLDRLIDIMSAVLPNELQDTLQNLQKVSLESKKYASQAVIATAVAASFGEGFAPIPFSDAALLVPTQVSMIAGITAIFGMDVSKSFLTGFISATLGTAGATILGKTIVSNLLKLIPGVGTVAGGAISGTTAGLLTTALGEAYIKIMELIYTGEMKAEDLYSDVGMEKMKNVFHTQLKSAK